MNTNFTATVHCPNCGGETVTKVSYSHDPGVRTFSNGDPGYPPSTEVILGNVDQKCSLCGHEFNDDEMVKMEDEAAEQLPDSGGQYDDDPFMRQEEDL